MPKPVPTPYTPTLPPSAAEVQAVHEVYEAIAPHFSSTRYKPWPRVSEFLDSLPENSLGLDSGAGNGKYVPSASESGRVVVALDMSWGLLGIAKGCMERGVECIRGELGFEGWREGMFDWAISIAAIHHLSTPARRGQAVQALLGSLAHRSKQEEGSSGRFLIYVWAYEQGEGSKRKMGKMAATAAEATSSTGPPQPDAQTEKENGTGTSGSNSAHSESTQPDEVDDLAEKVQDVLVPWVYQPKPPPSEKKPKEKGKKRQQKASDGPPSSAQSGATEVEPGSVSESTETEPSAAVAASQIQPQPQSQPEAQVFHRYYHLFLRGELRELVERAAREDGYIVLADHPEGAESGHSGVEAEGRGDKDADVEGHKWLRIRGVGWEADNWWIEGEVGKN